MAEALPWLQDVLAARDTLHDWASRHPGRRELSGRGQVFSVPAPVTGPDGSARWVVRHYYRGGALARHLGDRYLAVGLPRPVQEARAVAEARDRGIPTPSVVAGAAYPAGIFYRADLVTEEIPAAADLAHVLFSGADSAMGAEDALTAAGGLVRRLEIAGVLHPDMNAKNIVLQPVEGGARAHLVDMDRCCPRLRGVPAPAYPMRRRLERSLRKFETRTGTVLPESAWSALRRGFQDL
jgi:3-deoxy-D-manno-octulosonic acid kinase